MKKTKLTRSLLAACSIVALSVVLSGCLHSGGGDDADEMDTGGMMPEPEPMPDPDGLFDVPAAGLMAAAMAINAADDATADTTDADTVLNMDTAVTGVTNGKVDDDSNFMMSADSIATLSGWSGSGYEKSTAATGGVTPTQASVEALAIYNNKGMDEQVGYITRYTDNAPTGVTLAAATGVLTFTHTTASLGSHGDMLMLTGVMEPINYDNTPDDMTDNQEVGSRVMGSFHGIAGTFTCASTACRIVPIAGGGYETTGDWTFAPTVDENEPIADELADLMVTIDDQDYMYFGIWAQASTDADGDPTAMANAIFGGTMASQVATAGGVTGYQALTGSASYAGPATGLYVLKTFDTEGGSTPTSGGQFTAMANLTATFGTPTTVASDDHNTISGTITNFMANGEAIPGGWSLDLQNADISSSGPSDAAPIFSGMTRETDNDMGDQGAWRAQFFGAVTGDDTNTADVDETVFPSGVSGEFTGHFANGHVIGGFGAERQDSN